MFFFEPKIVKMQPQIELCTCSKLGIFNVFCKCFGIAQFKAAIPPIFLQCNCQSSSNFTRPFHLSCFPSLHVKVLPIKIPTFPVCCHSHNDNIHNCGYKQNKMTRIHILCHVLLVFNIFLIFFKNFFNLLIILNYIILLHSG